MSTTLAPEAVGLPPVPAPAVRSVGRAPVLVACAVPVAALVLLSFAGRQLMVVPGFQPAFLAVVLASDLLTAALLVTRYVVGGDGRLLALAWAYGWSASVIVPHFLVFPGLVTETGLFGATPSAAPWLWTAWHVGFPVLVGAALAPWPARYAAWLGRRDHRVRRTSASLLVVAAAATGVAALVTAGARWVPVIIADGDYRVLSATFGPYIVAANVAALLAAVVGVSLRAGRHGLETWALVAVVACVGDVTLTMLARGRFTVGWYGARALALLAAVVVLAALLREVTVLYRRIARTAAELEEQAAALADQNAELREAQALRQQLTAVVSHELRNPLTALRGYLEMLVDEGPGIAGGDRAWEVHARCLALVRRLSLMTEDLLTTHTAERGGLTVAPEPLDLDSQLADLAAAFPELDLQVEPAPGLVVAADPLRLQQVLANLVRNAQKYGTPPVRVRAYALGRETVVVEVTDEGAGVPLDFVPQLFDRFSRAPGTATTAPGVGLGLAVARDLALAHDGDLAYRPRDHTFVLTLPASARVEQPHAVRSPA